MALVTFAPTEAMQVTLRPRVFKVELGPIGFQGPEGPQGPQGLVSLDDENVWTANQVFPTDQFLTVQAKVNGGLIGGGSANGAADSAALASYLTLLGGLAPQRFVLAFEADEYWLDAFTMPWNVSLLGYGRAAKLVHRGTTGGRFITQLGSRSFIRGLTIDYRRDAQVSGAISGWASIVSLIPNGTAVGPEIMAGGLTLLANYAAGSTSIAVSAASVGGVPIQPDDAFNLKEGSNWEQVRVSSTYQMGQTTVALQSPLEHSYTAAGAKVTLCLTDAIVEDCTVFGQVTWGGGSSNHRVQNCTLLDAPDTNVGPFERGSFNSRILNNQIVSQGHWPIVVDGVSTGYPPHTDIEVRGNFIKMLDGAADYSALGDTATVGAVDAIIVTNAVRPSVTDNVIDMRMAGLRAIRFGDLVEDPISKRNTIVGGGASNTYGVANVFLTSGADPTCELSADDNTVEGVDFAIDFAGAVAGRARNNTIRDCVSAGINSVCPTSPTVARKMMVTGNEVQGAAVGIRFTGGPTAPGGSTVYTKLTNYLYGQSFTAKIIDTGWTETT